MRSREAAKHCKTSLIELAPSEPFSYMDKLSALPVHHSLPSPAHSSRSNLKRFFAGVLIAMLALASFSPLYRSCSGMRIAVSRHGCNRNLTTVGGAIRLSPNEVRYKLPSGDAIPSIALGTWKASTGEVGAAVSAALRAVGNLFFVSRLNASGGALILCAPGRDIGI